MEDFYQDGFNAGSGCSYINDGHDYPVTDSELWDYHKGIDYGKRRLEISRELEAQGY